MSEEGKRLLPGWAKRKLAELRRQQEDDGDRPDVLNALTYNLSLEDSSPDMGDFYQMLSFMIDDALNGIDISQRYPDLYRKITANESLHQAFIQGLESLSSGRDIEMPLPPSLDISFLHRDNLQHVISQIQPERWRIQWRRTIQQLQTIFQSRPLGLGYRDDFWLEDDGWQTILRSELPLVGVQLDVLLETQQPHSLEELTPLMLTLTRIQPESPWPEIRAEILWGEYHTSVSPVHEGRNALAPLQPAMILNKSGQAFRADLRLELDITSRPLP